MTKELIKRNEFNLTNEDWYNALLDDCKSIAVERSFRSRMEILEGKWELGERIIQDNENFEKRNIRGENVIENLSKNLGASKSDLWDCVKTYKESIAKYEADTFDKFISVIPEGKNLSWYKWRQEHLGNRGEKKKTISTAYKINKIKRTFIVWFNREFNEGESNKEFTEESWISFKNMLVGDE